MSDHDGGARKAVSLTDLASRVPGVLADMPVIVRGVLTGLLPAAELQEVDRHGVPGAGRALRRPGLPAIRRPAADLPRGQRDRQPVCRGAGRARCRPRRRRRHHAAQLAQRGAGDARRGQVRGRRRHAQLPPARRRAGAQPGPAGRQGVDRRDRPGQRRHRMRRRARHRQHADRRGPGAIRGERSGHQPGVGVGGAGQRHRVLHLHLGHHGISQGQRHDALSLAEGAGRVRRPGVAAQARPTRCTAACRCTTTTR